MYVLQVSVRDPVSGINQTLVRQFDPTQTAAQLQAAWNNLGPAVLALITQVQALAASAAAAQTL